MFPPCGGTWAPTSLVRLTLEPESLRRQDRQVALGAAATYGVLEAAFGLLVVLATAGRGRVPSHWLDIIRTTSHADVGAFGARWALSASRGLQRGGKFLLGMGLVADGSIRLVLSIGVLRGSRVMTMSGAVVFTGIALAGLVVAGANPPPIRLATALANSGVAYVAGVDAYRLWRRRQ